MADRRGWELAGHDEDLAEDQQVADDRDDAVGANRSMAGRPRKHEQAENRHEPVRPDESGDSKDQVQLHNEVDDQIFHIKMICGGTLILLQRVRFLEAEVTKVTMSGRSFPDLSNGLAVTLLPIFLLFT